MPGGWACWCLRGGLWSLQCISGLFMGIIWGTSCLCKILQHCLLLPEISEIALSNWPLEAARSWVLEGLIWPAGQLEQCVPGEFHRQWSSSRQSPWDGAATNALSREWWAARWAHFIRPFVGICGSRRLWFALWSPSSISWPSGTVVRTANRWPEFFVEETHLARTSHSHACGTWRQVWSAVGLRWVKI